MTSSTDLRALQLIAERSPEGAGVPVETIASAGYGTGTIRTLQREGLVDVLDDDGEPTVVVTDLGRDEVLRPHNSL